MALHIFDLFMDFFKGKTVALIDMTMQTFEPSISENEIVFVDFWAEWCGPCKQFLPIYEKLAAKHSDILFGKVNTDSEQDLSAMFGITSVPTLAILRQGILLFKEPGVHSEEQLEQVIEQVRGLDMDDVRAQVAGQSSGGGCGSGGCGSGGCGSHGDGESSGGCCSSGSDEGVVCSCYGVSEDEIVAAITEHGLTSVDQVTSKTNAGGGCGSCKSTISQLVESVNNGTYVAGELASSGGGCGSGGCGCH